MIKPLLLAIMATVLFSGCHSTHHSLAPRVAYPTPQVPLSEFFQNPVKGTYSLPQTATVDQWRSDGTIIVISENDIHLDTLQENGQVTSDKWGVIEFKSKLPSEEIFQQITLGADESDVVRILGQPTRESFDYYPILGIRGRDTKCGNYSWFTVTPTSELIFMRVHAYFQKTKDSRWIFNELSWDKSGGRSLASPAKK